MQQLASYLTSYSVNLEPSATVHEALMTAAVLKLPYSMTNTEKLQRVDHLLHKLVVVALSQVHSSLMADPLVDWMLLCKGHLLLSAGESAAELDELTKRFMEAILQVWVLMVRHQRKWWRTPPATNAAKVVFTLLAYAAVGLLACLISLGQSPEKQDRVLFGALSMLAWIFGTALGSVMPTVATLAAHVTFVPFDAGRLLCYVVMCYFAFGFNLRPTLLLAWWTVLVATNPILAQLMVVLFVAAVIKLQMMNNSLALAFRNVPLDLGPQMVLMCIIPHMSHPYSITGPVVDVVRFIDRSLGLPPGASSATSGEDNLLLPAAVRGWSFLGWVMLLAAVTLLPKVLKFFLS
eukprot:gene12018-12162_t